MNQSPVLAGIETLSLYYQPSTPAQITATITAGDVDSANLAGATIKISTNYQKGSDVLAFKNSKKIVGKWNATTGVLALSGSDSVADYQAALQAVTYQNKNATASTAARTVTFQVSDGSTGSNSLSRSIVFSASGAAATWPGGRIADLAGLTAASAASDAFEPVNRPAGEADVCSPTWPTGSSLACEPLCRYTALRIAGAGVAAP